MGSGNVVGGGKTDPGSGPGAQITPGFEFLPQFLQQLAAQIGPQLGNIFGAQQFPLGDLVGQAQAATRRGGETAGRVGRASAGQFQEGLQTGFAPEILADIEARLLPGLERSFERGEADIRESAANLGTLNATGTVSDIGRLRGGLESGLQESLAGIQGQLGLGSQQVRAGLASQGVNLPFQQAASLIPFITAALQSSQFGASQPLQAIQALAGGAQATPQFQPQATASKGQQAAGKGNTIANLGAAFG